MNKKSQMEFGDDTPLNEVYVMCLWEVLSKKHKVEHYKLIIRGKWRKGVLADTSYSRQEIRFNRGVPTEKVKEVLLHEIAHILSPAYRGDNGRWVKHGREWRETCVRIGGVGRSCCRVSKKESERLNNK